MRVDTSSCLSRDTISMSDHFYILVFIIISNRVSTCIKVWTIYLFTLRYYPTVRVITLGTKIAAKNVRKQFEGSAEPTMKYHIYCNII